MSHTNKILVALASTILWPLVHIGIFILRFPQNPVPYGELLGFVLMGLIPGILLANWLQESKSKRQRMAALVGYAIASPFAFIGSLGGGLFFTLWLGATIFGGLPLILGAWLGYALGGRLSKRSAG